MLNKKITWFVAIPLGGAIGALWLIYSMNRASAINSFGTAFGIWLIETILIAAIALGLLTAGIADLINRLMSKK